MAGSKRKVTYILSILVEVEENESTIKYPEPGWAIERWSPSNFNHVKVLDAAPVRSALIDWSASPGLGGMEQALFPDAQGKKISHAGYDVARRIECENHP